MKILCVIPSRMHSTRLPQKPILPIQGKPMVQWTYENAKKSEVIFEVIVATDHESIAKIIEDVGGKVAMTPSELATGTERVAYVAEQYPDVDVVINLQGDEPFIKPSMLRELVTPYLNGERPDMTTLAYPLHESKYSQAGTVKVITDRNHNAIYFSRAPIPYYREKVLAPVYNHMGLYAFTREFLLKFKQLTPTPLEQVERLEQLRALEHGYKIRVCYTKDQTLEINTPDEYQAAQTFHYDS